MKKVKSTQKQPSPKARKKPHESVGFEPPEILWTEKIQTLGYQCNSGPYPYSGNPTTPACPTT